MTLDVSADAGTLAAHVADLLQTRIARLQADGVTPSIVLTGGTIAQEIYTRLDAAAVDWSHVDFWWGDERFVAADDPDYNARQAREAFLDRVGADPLKVHAIPADDGTYSAGEAAAMYAAHLPPRDFDVVLLGVGPDGHVASLFPGFAQLHEHGHAVVEVEGSPKPPPTRITLTFPSLCSADSVWFVVSGEGKAEAVRRAHDEGTVDDTPAVGVTGKRETLWLVDADAATLLPATSLPAKESASGRS